MSCDFKLWEDVPVFIQEIYSYLILCVEAKIYKAQ